MKDVILNFVTEKVIPKTKSLIKKLSKLTIKIVSETRSSAHNAHKNIAIKITSLKSAAAVNVPVYLNKAKINILDLVSDDTAGIRIIKRIPALIFYLVIFVSLTLIANLSSHKSFTSSLMHPDNGSELLIGVSSLLLALLLPVAILIIQDSKDVLMRRTVVKNIIQLNRLPIIVSLISIVLFIPAGQTINSSQLTARTIGGAVAGTCFIYIVIMLLKSYRWLSDGSEAPSGLQKPPKLDDPDTSYPNQFVSYRFAQIVKFLNESTSHEAWTQLWAKWWPYIYDEVLHQSFFKRHKSILLKNETKKYKLLSNELAAYRYNINQRILEDYPYTVSYLGEFLELYSLMHDGATFKPKDKALYTANNFTSIIIREIISKNMTEDRVYYIATAIDAYVTKRYDDSGEANRAIKDPVLSNFIRVLYDSVLDDKVSYYDLRSSFSSFRQKWEVTYSTVFEKPNAISLTMINTFYGWFKERLKDMNPDDTNFNFSNVLQFVFPSSDTITLGYLFWYLNLSENLVDEKEGLVKFMTTSMPFVLMSNTKAEFVPAGSEKDSLTRFKKQLKEQEDDAIKLFANLYRDYFTRTRNLDSLILKADEVAKAATKEAESAYMQHLADIFKVLNEYYRSKPTA